MENNSVNYLASISGGMITTEILTEKDAMILLEKFFNLLAYQTERYTTGDSSSIPIETAEELLKSICFTIAFLTKTDPNPVCLLLQGNFNVLLHDGWERIKAEMKRGKELLKKVRESTPTSEPLFYKDTLTNIDVFFKRYDYHFFAHEIPDIFYQLSQPVPQELQGIEYVNEYLRRLLKENQTGLTTSEEIDPIDPIYGAEGKSAVATQFMDNDMMDDDALRKLIEKMNDCRFVSDKIALVRREIHSLRDMVEVLNICFWEEERTALFDNLNIMEISLLVEFVSIKGQEKQSETGWEMLLIEMVQNEYFTGR